MLNARDAFKVGFLSRCVEDGVPAEKIEFLVKRAAALLEKHAIIGGLLSAVADTGKSVGSGLMHYGVPAALIAPPLIGGALGYGAAKATDIDDTDVDDIKNKEVVDEYQRQSEKLRRLQAVRTYAKQKHKTGRVFI